jgi:hypothetical protein
MVAPLCMDNESSMSTDAELRSVIPPLAAKTFVLDMEPVLKIPWVEIAPPKVVEALKVTPLSKVTDGPVKVTVLLNADVPEKA